MPNTNQKNLEEFKRILKEKPITFDEAKVLLYAIDNEFVVKVDRILVNDEQALQCHWRCSVRNHGPVGVSLEDFKREILDPVTNPGNGGEG